MSKPLVDIVVATNGNLEILRKTLQSVKAQTFLDYQCYIVVDNPSKNRRVNIFREEFPSAIVLENKKCRGPAYSRNLAIAQGKAPFIAILDDDVILSPDWLKEMLGFISFSPTIAAVGSQLRFADSPSLLNGIGGYLVIDGWGGTSFLINPFRRFLI